MSIQRTPPPIQMPLQRPIPMLTDQIDDDDIQEELLTPKISIKRSNLKRAGDKIERSTDDLYECIMNLGSRLSTEFKSECTSIKEELTTKLDEKFAMLDTDMKEMNVKVKNLEESVNRNEKKLDQQGKIVNRLLQEKLQTKMEISGATIPYMNDKEKIKEEVKKIIGKFNINVETANMKTVYIKNVKAHEPANEVQQSQIITVEFDNFETKIRILKEKKKSRIKNGIFFGDSLTPTNRFLIGKAKKIAKEKNFMVYMSNNRINVKKSDKEIKWIEDEADLNDIKSWLPNERNVNGQSRSANKTQA
ncbi:hypothetical protein ACKWTF_002456 [Chironomus riparius]